MCGDRLMELTDTGRQVAHDFRLLIHQNQKTWLSVLTKQEQIQLIDTLHRIQAALNDSPS
jgi:DNA-binding MarR family transcriptional regulator